MRIEVNTSRPKSLFNIIHKDISDGERRTWIFVYDSNDQEFITHKPEQYFSKALISERFESNKLIFEVTWFSDHEEPDEYTKGFYMGRFSEMLLGRYSSEFENLQIYPR